MLPDGVVQMKQAHRRLARPGELTVRIGTPLIFSQETAPDEITREREAMVRSHPNVLAPSSYFHQYPQYPHQILSRFTIALHFSDCNLPHARLCSRPPEKKFPPEVSQ
jgi:hypothetical protein